MGETPHWARHAQRAFLGRWHVHKPRTGLPEVKVVRAEKSLGFLIKKLRSSLRLPFIRLVPPCSRCPEYSGSDVPEGFASLSSCVGQPSLRAFRKMVLAVYRSRVCLSLSPSPPLALSFSLSLSLSRSLSLSPFSGGCAPSLSGKPKTNIMLADTPWS